MGQRLMWVRAPAAVLLAEQHAHEAPGLGVLAGGARGARLAQPRQRVRVAARHRRLKLSALSDQLALRYHLPPSTSAVMIRLGAHGEDQEHQTDSACCTDLQAQCFSTSHCHLSHSQAW